MSTFLILILTALASTSVLLTVTAVALFRFLRVFGAHIRTLDAEAGS